MTDYPNLTEEQTDMYQDDAEYLEYLNQKSSKMQEIKGNMWETECDAVCITTNGYLKMNSEAVMGRGCAKQAAEYFPEIPKILGERIKKYGNVVSPIRHFEGVAIVSFPVKSEGFKFQNELDCEDIVKHMRYRFKAGETVPGWACVADIEIIKKSADQLVKMASSHGWKKVLLPRPGCGSGELSWADVKPVLDEILDDRFYVITYE